jgi:hypothetical protein
VKLAKTLLLVVLYWCGQNSVFAQTWTQQVNMPQTAWAGIASSADGNRLIAVGLDYACYTSTNSGSTWTSNSEPQSGSTIGSWYTIASSVDGTKLVAATVSSSIWVSTNSGTTWFSNNVPTVSEWGPVAMSADGNTILAAAGGNSHPPGFIYVSTNWGASWNPTSAPTNVWMSIASSADGAKLVAVAGEPYTGVMYISTNSGTTWTQTSAPGKYWGSVASSADGVKLVAVNQLENGAAPGHVYTSADSGATWTSNGLATCLWQSVAVSADGNTIVAGGSPINNPCDVYVSTNFGVSWVSNTLSSDFFGGYVLAVNSSADGGKFFASSLGGLICSSQSIVAPQLKLASLTCNLNLSWIVPSTNFVLQQNLDLTTTNWMDVTNTPALNLANLQNEIVLSPSNSSGFYRLRTP